MSPESSERAIWAGWVAQHIGGNPERQEAAVHAALQARSHGGSPQEAANAAFQLAPSAAQPQPLAGSAAAAQQAGAESPDGAWSTWVAENVGGDEERQRRALDAAFAAERRGQPRYVIEASARSAASVLEPASRTVEPIPHEPEAVPPPSWPTDEPSPAEADAPMPRRMLGVQRLELVFGLVVLGVLVVGGFVGIRSFLSRPQGGVSYYPNASNGRPVPSPSPTMDPAVPNAYLALAAASNAKEGPIQASLLEARSHDSSGQHRVPISQIRVDYAQLSQATQEFDKGLSQLPVPDWVKPHVRAVNDDDSRLLAVYDQMTRVTNWADFDRLDQQLCECVVPFTADIAQLRQDLGLPPPT